MVDFPGLRDDPGLFKPLLVTVLFMGQRCGSSTFIIVTYEDAFLSLAKVLILKWVIFSGNGDWLIGNPKRRKGYEFE